MSQHVVVVGAGVIGASIAFHAARHGLLVTVVDAIGPAAAASGASFGWINASFHLGAAHHRLRVEGMAAHRRLAEALPDLPIESVGCVYFADEPSELARAHEELRGFGYPVQRLSRTEIAERIPALAHPPDAALYFPDESAVDAAALARRLMSAAMALGARLLRGVAVEALLERGGRITGVRTPLGAIAADEVVVANGTGAPPLLTPLGLDLRLLERPALLIQSDPLPPLLDVILASESQELRQLPNGRMLAPGSAAHQGDDAERIDAEPAAIAEAAMARLADLFGLPISPGWRDCALGRRPMPEDGLPVLGRWGPPGLSVAVTHSGVTLAAIIGEALAATLCETPAEALLPHAQLLAPFRPTRLDDAAA